CLAVERGGRTGDTIRTPQSAIFFFFLHPSAFPSHRKISASQGDVVGIWSLTSTLPREALAHRNHSGRTGGFSPRARRAFLSREADYRLDLQKTRRLLRRDDGFT